MQAYLDDYCACHHDLDQAQAGYNVFVDLASELGLQLSAHKCVPPTTRLEWLGYDVDTVAMTISVPCQKLSDLELECKTWLSKKRASKRMIQSIAGKLLYISSCIQSARKFTARILATLRSLQDGAWTTISPGFKADLQWFLHFARSANGVLYYTPSRPEVHIECDSSLFGGGGVGPGLYYAWSYSKTHMGEFKSIVHLEAINLLVSYRTFAPAIKDRGVNLVIYTNNRGSACALETGRTRDDLLAKCARELWLEATTNNHNIIIRHKAGKDIPLADALSRKDREHDKARFVREEVQRLNLMNIAPKLNGYKFFNEFI